MGQIGTPGMGAAWAEQDVAVVNDCLRHDGLDRPPDPTKRANRRHKRNLK